MLHLLAFLSLLQTLLRKFSEQNSQGDNCPRFRAGHIISNILVELSNFEG
jgi:hypothetical protein